MASILGIIPRLATFITQRGGTAAKETKMLLALQEKLELSTASTRVLSSYTADEAIGGFSLVERKSKGNAIFVSQEALSRHHRDNFFISRIRPRNYQPFATVSSVFDSQNSSFQRRLFSSGSRSPHGDRAGRDVIKPGPFSPVNTGYIITGGGVLLLAALFFGGYMYCEGETEGEFCSTFLEKIGKKKE